MQTLIGGDGVVMTLSGRIEIGSDVTTAGSLQVGGRVRTVIEANPGIGVKTQRIALNGLKILDVETLAPSPRPLVTVERNWDPEAGDPVEDRRL